MYQNKVTVSLASIHNCKMAYSNEESIKELFVFIYFSVSWNLNKVFSKKKPFLIGKKDCCLDTACYACLLYTSDAADE